MSIPSEFRSNIPSFGATSWEKTRELVWPVCASPTVYPRKWTTSLRSVVENIPTDYYGDINYDEFPNGSDIMGVQMALKSSKKDI